MPSKKGKTLASAIGPKQMAKFVMKNALLQKKFNSF